MPSTLSLLTAAAVLLASSVSGATALRKQEPGAAFLENRLPKASRTAKTQLKSALQELKARRPHATSQDALNLVSKALHDAAAEEYRDLQSALAADLAATVTVQTPLGAVTGIQGNGSNAFLGLPYAQPPLGALRWKAPQPITSFNTTAGAYNATAFRYVCPQPGKTWELFSPGQNEDCLYANVYAPQRAAPAGSGGWPVMIFFHGGSWVFGSGSFPLYWGTNDVAMLQNAVIITINYRLSVLGFLGGDALKAESPDGSTGNFGFQDQRQSMVWAKQIASSFGGNPNLVTIFGESAGAGSVSAHLVAPRSSGLFQRAVMESTGFGPWAAQPYAIANQRFGQIVSNCGCSAAKDVVACMRALTWNALLSCDSGNVLQGVVEWSPVVDGVELTDTPFNLVSQGKLASDVPVLFGFNKDEGTLFNHESYTLNASQYEAAIAGYLSGPLATKVAQQYPVSEFSTPWWGVSQILRDSVMLCPATSAANSITTKIPTRNPANGVYTYFYTKLLWVVQYVVDAFKPLGVFHGSELLMVFDFELGLLGSGEKQMAQTMVKYWTNFAATGNPNVGMTGTTNNVPQWPRWGAANNASVSNAMVQIDGNAAGANVTIIDGLQLEQSNCAFWAQNPVPLTTIFG